MRSTQAHSSRVPRHLPVALLIALVGLGAAALGPGAAWAQTDAPEAFIGTWTGTFDFGGDEARPVFHIERTDDGDLTASMDAPDMGLTGIPVSRVVVDGDSLTLAVDSLNGRFEGVLAEADTIDGAWKNNDGRSWPLTLSPAGPEASVPTRYRERPEADPADVKSPDAIVGALYDAVSVAKTDSIDWDRFRSLFLPEARLVPTSRADGGGAGYWAIAVEEWVKSSKSQMQQRLEAGYLEREVHAVTERFGDIAQVFSTYEAIHTAKGPEPVDRGINSFQLWYDGDRWWIMSLLWHTEREDAPVPERYTK
jgi:hypothetical protein